MLTLMWIKIFCLLFWYGILLIASLLLIKLVEKRDVDVPLFISLLFFGCFYYAALNLVPATILSSSSFLWEQMGPKIAPKEYWTDHLRTFESAVDFYERNREKLEPEQSSRFYAYDKAEVARSKIELAKYS